MDMKNVCSHLVIERNECGCRRSLLSGMYVCGRIIDKQLPINSVNSMGSE